MSKNTYALCRVAVLAALYAVLTSFLSIRAGNLRITLASLPIVVCALLFGPAQAVTAAALGELINQVMLYGLTLTTPLWLVPPALRGLLVGLAALAAVRRGRPLEGQPAKCWAVCVAAAMGTTVCNTGIIWLDSVIYHYYTFVYVFGDLAVRMVTSVITALAVTAAAIPLVRFLRRGHAAGVMR